jgi:hypothetical protein
MDVAVGLPSRALLHLSALEHDPEKRVAVFRKGHAQPKSQSTVTILADLIAP